jgi:nitrogen fixation/metabolism regulation signal transduction histidine kinase
VSGFVLSAYFVRRITGPLVVLTDAADAIAHEQYEKAGALRPIQSRNDEFGRLAGAFGFMLEKVRAREEKLKKEVRELHIQIDKTRQRQEVSRITGSDYFIKLKQKAADMRRQNG